jgi:hypothetical protein
VRGQVRIPAESGNPQPPRGERGSSQAKGRSKSFAFGVKDRCVQSFMRGGMFFYGRTLFIKYYLWSTIINHFTVYDIYCSPFTIIINLKHLFLIKRADRGEKIEDTLPSQKSDDTLPPRGGWAGEHES